MSNKVAIAGVGMSKFGELWDKNLRDITLEAGMYAIFDAGVPGSEIDGMVIGNMSAGRFTGQEHLGAQEEIFLRIVSKQLAPVVVQQ